MSNSNAPRAGSDRDTSWLVKTMLGQQSAGGGAGQGQANLRFQDAQQATGLLDQRIAMALQGAGPMLQLPNGADRNICLPVNSVGGDGNSNTMYQQLQELGLRTLLQGSSTSGVNVQASDKDRTSMKKSQGTSCVPCRARGMSMQHNFQTAYFSITPDTKHGDGLICSFPDCRNRGVKFLYCAYCKDPVAKRNFRTRHNHAAGMRNGSVDPSKTSRPTQDLQQEQSRQEKVSTKTEKSPATVVSTLSAQSSKNTGPGSSVSKSIEETKKRIAGLSECSNDSSPQPKKAKTGETDETSETDETNEKDAPHVQRKKAWGYLLSSRPSTDQGDEMSQWLMQVMSISDPHKPMAEVAAHLDVFKSNEPSSMEEVTNESSSSVSSSRNNGGGSTDTASSGSPATESSSNEDSNESSPTDGSSNGDSNDSSEENHGSDSNSESQDPIETLSEAQEIEEKHPGQVSLPLPHL